jgi:hypothetical protein
MGERFMRQTTSRRGLLDVSFDYIFYNFNKSFRLMELVDNNKAVLQEVQTAFTPLQSKALQGQINLAL